MKLDDITALMESITPRSLALEFDNPGLIVSPACDDITRVMVALDCTLPVIREAAELGCQLIITHHPLLFRPVKHVLADDPDTAPVYELIRRGIGHFAAHTNLDAAAGGVNDVLAGLMGLKSVRPLPPDGLGRMGTLESGMTLGDAARLACKVLDARVSICGDESAPAHTLGIIGGSGGSEIMEAKKAGCDCFLTGELKHSSAIDAQLMGIGVIVAGHYETERVVLAPLIKRLQNGGFDVQYNLTHSETSVIRPFEG